MTNDVRRRRLARAVKLLSAAGLLAFVWVLLQSAVDRTPRNAGPDLVIDPAGLVPGEATLVDWHGRRLVVLARTPQQRTTLERPNPALLDPDSHHSRQPAAAANPFRSLRPDLFLALGHDTGPGCVVAWHPAATTGAPQPWYGGFRDRCRGSWYDLAGRVYRDQAAPRNLTVPPYRIRDDGRIAVGE